MNCTDVLELIVWYFDNPYWTREAFNEWLVGTGIPEAREALDALEEDE